MSGAPILLWGALVGAVVGATCSLVGVHVLLRRMVFLALALAQVASAGVALALLVGLPPLPVALAASLAGALGLSRLGASGPLPREALLGAVWVVAGAVGIVCVALNPVGEARALTALFGNILGVPAREFPALLLAAAAVLGVHARWHRELVFVGFDPDAAAAQGFRPRRWDLLLHATLAVAVAVSIRSAGLTVTFALVILPALGARAAVSSVGALCTLAAVLGTLGVPAGLAVAWQLDLPTGAGIALTLAALAGAAALVGRLRRARSTAVAALAAVLGLGAFAPASAETPAGIERELGELRRTVEELRRRVEEQRRRIDELQGTRLSAPARTTESPVAPTPPAPAAGSPAPPGAASDRPALAPAPRPETTAPPALPPWIALMPELRLEGNMVGNYTFGNRRKLERALGEEREGEEVGIRRNRFDVKEVELGLRAAIDPFTRFEAVFSAEQARGGELEVGLEEASLTFTALPGKLELRAGRFRTGFGEFNDSDPEEFPAVDVPNVIRHLFGAEGWIDTGLALTRRFGVTDDFSLTLWAAVFNGDNETAFHGGRAGAARRPAWFGRVEGFWELGDSVGLEAGLGLASGRTLDEAGRPRLASRIANAHLELDWRHPLLGLYRGVNFVGEAFYSWREEEDEGERSTLGRWGWYALAEAQVSRHWSVGARLDWAELPERPDGGPAVGRDRAGSLIVSWRPSRFFTLRGQWKHTERNWAPDSDELFLQGLFTLGYERPGPF